MSLGTLLDLDGLVDAYWAVVAPAMCDAGLHPKSERPSYSWLRDHDFRKLVYALREYHDRTFTEFWQDDLDLQDAPDGYDWGITHEPTIDALEDFLDYKRTRGGLAESSIDTLRYRLARYVRAYRDANDTDDLLSPVTPKSDTPATDAVDACWAAFDQLHENLDSNRTKRRIHRITNGWYTYLRRRKLASVNPADGLDDIYRWEVETSNPSQLSADHVRTLYQAAAADRERLLILALCAWGLRSGEVAALHRSNVVLEDESAEVPYLNFDERKNGPGQVSLLFGVPELEERLVAFADCDDWNGYLFPSTQSAAGHVSSQTIRNWFNSLVEKTDVPEEIRGETVIPRWAGDFGTTSTPRHSRL